jgi:hypothetical protein
LIVKLLNGHSKSGWWRNTNHTGKIGIQKVVGGGTPTTRVKWAFKMWLVAEHQPHGLNGHSKSGWCLLKRKLHVAVFRRLNMTTLYTSYRCLLLGCFLKSKKVFYSFSQKARHRFIQAGTPCCLAFLLNKKGRARRPFL